jgi:ssDNA-binding Zn-finger/Zn-ribbon topoisomerase 1
LKRKIEYFCPKCKKIVRDTYGMAATMPANSMQAFAGGIGELTGVCAKCDTPLMKLRSKAQR